MSAPFPAIAGQPTDRRGFLRCSACSLAGLAVLTLPACGGDGPTGPGTGNPKGGEGGDGPPKFEIDGSQVRVFLDRVPELAAVPGFFVIEQAQTIVVRISQADYAAFSAVCTHEGCTVNMFMNNRMVCPCHGSTYDMNGRVVAGPAVGSLPRFSVSLDTATKELLVTRTI